MLIKLMGKMAGVVKMNGRIIGLGFFYLFYLEQIVDALFNKIMNGLQRHEDD